MLGKSICESHIEITFIKISLVWGFQSAITLWIAQTVKSNLQLGHYTCKKFGKFSEKKKINTLLVAIIIIENKYPFI